MHQEEGRDVFRRIDPARIGRKLRFFIPTEDGGKTQS
jgi:hypothetical protein